MIRYHFQFKPTVPFEEIDGNLMLFTLAAECIHGRTKVRLEARFEASRKDNTCWIDASTEVGEHIALMFSGIMAYLFGERSFKVQREVIENTVASSGEGVAA